MENRHRIVYLSYLKRQTANPEKREALDEAMGKIADQAPAVSGSNLSREQVIEKMREGVI